MNRANLRILYALPTIGHPRDSKRIAMLQNVGFQVEAIAFERKSHSDGLMRLGCLHRVFTDLSDVFLSFLRGGLSREIYHSIPILPFLL